MSSDKSRSRQIDLSSRKSMNILNGVTEPTSKKAVDVQKEGPILKHGNRFGKIRRIEQRWLKLTDSELMYSVSRGKKPIAKISVADIAMVYTREVSQDDRSEDETTTSSQNAANTIYKNNLAEEDFVICTSSTGLLQGKQLVFKALTSRLRDEWVDAIGSLRKEAQQTSIQNLQTSTAAFARFRHKLRILLTADDFQAFIGFMVSDSCTFPDGEKSAHAVTSRSF
jgi:hypothetical protein